MNQVIYFNYVYIKCIIDQYTCDKAEYVIEVLYVLKS